MKKILCKLTVVTASAIAMLTAAMPASAADDILRFGVAAEPYPPFLSKTPTGNWVGFEPDLIRALCEEMKAKCEIKEIAWDGIIAALMSNKIDLIFNSMTISPERKKVIAFSHPYYESPDNTFVAAKSSKLVFTPEGLRGKVIGVEGASGNAEFIKGAYGKTATVRLYDTQDDCNADLSAGRIDAMYIDGLAVLDFLKTPEGQAFEAKGPGGVKLDPAVVGGAVAAGLRKSDTALKQRIDAAIVQLHDSGKYAQIEKKYFPIDIWPHSN